jgi:aspartyl-tRNA(Asn)/glutamyl-tRNA(Gln) amidotransferase subunit A
MNDAELKAVTISETSHQIRNGQISPVELTEFCLNKIKRLNPTINAFLTITEDGALADAKVAEKEIRRGLYRGPLHGIPFSIKDNIAMKGVRTTAGSKLLSEWKPDYDATVIARLKEAGAIILGKTNMSEWALGGTTINPYYGTTRNPWDLSRIAGGSSGGSGAAVSSGMCLASIGTDSAQSVRNPASMCGIVGLKPTYGRISQFGQVAGSGGFSTNCIGILTKKVDDCALVLEAIAGYDPKDPLSAKEPVPEYSKDIEKHVKGIKVGVIRGYFDNLMSNEVKNALTEAIKTLVSLGMIMEDVSIPHMDLIPAVKLCTSRVENASEHLHYLRTRPGDYSANVRNSYICALLIPASTYVTAQRVRRMICDEFDEALKKVNVIVAPTVPFAAPTIEECMQGFIEIDGKRIPWQDPRGGIDSLCAIPFNVTGLPAISVCCGFSRQGLPMGMQIASSHFSESIAFRVAHAYESAAGWYQRHPQAS